MSVFHGDWNEDPKEFLNSYLQCTAAGDDRFKARQFINYLGAGSEELLQEERKDCEAIECLFRRRWLKEEVIVSIKEISTTKNVTQISPHSSKIAQSQVFIPQKPSDAPTTSPTTSNIPTKAKTTIVDSQPFKVGKKHEISLHKQNLAKLT